MVFHPCKSILIDPVSTAIAAELIPMLVKTACKSVCALRVPVIDPQVAPPAVWSTAHVGVVPAEVNLSVPPQVGQLKKAILPLIFDCKVFVELSRLFNLVLVVVVDESRLLRRVFVVPVEVSKLSNRVLVVAVELSRLSNLVLAVLVELVAAFCQAFKSDCVVISPVIVPHVPPPTPLVADGELTWTVPSGHLIEVGLNWPATEPLET